MPHMRKVTAPRNTVVKGQPHKLAYINDFEEGLLLGMGGSGEAGPMAIPAFADTGGDVGTEGEGMNEGQSSGAGQGMGGIGDPSGNISAYGVGVDPFGLSNYALGINLGQGLLGMLGMEPATSVSDLAGHAAADADNVGEGPSSAISYFYNVGEGPSSLVSNFYNVDEGLSIGGGGCPTGYVFDNDLQACVVDIGTSAEQPETPPTDYLSGAYYRPTALDQSPANMSGLFGDFNFEKANQDFINSFAYRPSYYENQMDLTGFSPVSVSERPDDAASMPMPAVPSPIASTPAPTPSRVMPPSNYGRIDSLYTDEGNLSPTGEFIGTIVGLGIDDPLIQRAQDVLGPSSGEPWARALNIAAKLPTPDLGYATRGQYLESLGEIGQRVGVVGTKIQDDTGRTIGYQGFERPEGDG